MIEKRRELQHGEPFNRKIDVKSRKNVIKNKSMIFLLTPYIFKLRSAPPLYPSIIFIYTYIAIIILTNIIVYKFFNRQKLIRISYISSLITYMVLFFITFFNIIIFFYG